MCRGGGLYQRGSLRFMAQRVGAFVAFGDPNSKFQRPQISPFMVGEVPVGVWPELYVPGDGAFCGLETLISKSPPYSPSGGWGFTLTSTLDPLEGPATPSLGIPGCFPHQSVSSLARVIPVSGECTE